jgi:hypothetical protein
MLANTIETSVFKAITFLNYIKRKTTAKPKYSRLEVSTASTKCSFR